MSATAAKSVSTKLAHALALAEKGYWVFPLRPMGKTTWLDSWKGVATRDADQIRKWWGERPNSNIAIATDRFGNGEALCVVDVDVKGSANGFGTQVQLDLDGQEFPPTLEADTPSGGRHLYYVVDKPLNQGGAGCVGPGVDLRSGGGYVVAPGSETSAGRYTWRDNVGPAATCPQWLIQARGYHTDKPTPDTKPVTVDEGSATVRALSYLAHEAPQAVEGAGGDSTTFTVAARLKDFGVTEQTAYLLLSSSWNHGNSPPWSESDLKTKVRNAYSYGRNGIGASSPESDFGPVAPDTNDPFDTTPKPKPKRLHFPEPADGDITALLDSEPPERVFLVDKLLPAGKVVAIVGTGGAGKSAFALDIAMAVKSGGNVAGHPEWTANGARDVLYIGVEDDRDEVHRRLHELVQNVDAHTWRDAPKARERFRGGGRFIYHDAGGADTRLTDATGKFTPAVDEIIEYAGRYDRLGLIILDPGVSFLGGDENSNGDVQALVRALRHIAEQTGATVVIVHHTSKGAGLNGSREAGASRGASAFENGARLTINVATMSEAEAKGYDLRGAERTDYLGVAFGKFNYGARLGVQWLRRRNSSALWYDPPAERKAASTEDEYQRVLDFALEKIAAGGEYSTREFSELFGGLKGPLRLGEKKLRAHIKGALDSGELKLVRVKRRQGGSVDALTFGAAEVAKIATGDTLQ